MRVHATLTILMLECLIENHNKFLCTLYSCQHIYPNLNACFKCTCAVQLSSDHYISCCSCANRTLSTQTTAAGIILANPGNRLNPIQIELRQACSIWRTNKFCRYWFRSSNYMTSTSRLPLRVLETPQLMILTCAPTSCSTIMILRRHIYLSTELTLMRPFWARALTILCHTVCAVTVLTTALTTIGANSEDSNSQVVITILRDMHFRMIAI